MTVLLSWIYPMCQHRKTKIVSSKYLPYERGPYIYVTTEICLDCGENLNTEEKIYGN